MVTLGPLDIALADLLRLVAVPVLGWAAYRDVRTRRVPNRTWLPLVVVGLLALALDAWALRTADPFSQRLYVVQVLISLLLVGGLAYAFWRLGGFGGADAKGLMALAVLYPTYPTVIVRGTGIVLPSFEATLGVFSLTVLTNTVLLGLAAPLALAGRNLLGGRLTPAMFIGRPLPVESLPTAYGRLLETPDGFTRRGLDLDALRMYLRWRGTTLAALRADPAAHRDPDAIGETYEPGDGSLAESGPGDVVTDGGVAVADEPGATPTDEWGAARFLAEIEGSAYGTTPEGLREGLAVVADAEAVWVSPGMPFIVPIFGGLLVGLVAGDLLFALLLAVGLV